MRKELENFDRRIRLLLQGKQEDLSTTKMKIEEVKKNTRIG